MNREQKRTPLTPSHRHLTDYMSLVSCVCAYVCVCGASVMVVACARLTSVQKDTSYRLATLHATSCCLKCIIFFIWVWLDYNFTGSACADVTSVHAFFKYFYKLIFHSVFQALFLKKIYIYFISCIVAGMFFENRDVIVILVHGLN